MATADLLPNKSHATANVSLLARLKKLSTATLTYYDESCCVSPRVTSRMYAPFERASVHVSR